MKGGGLGTLRSEHFNSDLGSPKDRKTGSPEKGTEIAIVAIPDLVLAR
jgi:hypothetical protein